MTTRHIEAVEDTLAEIDASDMPRLLVLNKIDRLEGPLPQVGLVDSYTGIAPISAQEQTGLEDLLQSIADVLAQQKTLMDVIIPYQSGQIYSELYDKRYIEAETVSEDGWALTLRLPIADSDHYREFIVDETSLPRNSAD